MREEMKTGTTTLGFKCKEGIVLATDRKVTSGFFIAGSYEKVVRITDDIAVTIAGTVSDIQLLTKLIKAELKLKNLRTGKITNVKEATNLLSSLVYNNIRKFSLIPGISHFIIAGKDYRGFHIYDLSPDGSVNEIKDFVSSGSGSTMVYGLLEAEYSKDISIKEGIELAKRCINSAIQRDAASGNGIDIYTITKEGIKKVFEKELKVKVE